jgi:hypothetical protein
MAGDAVEHLDERGRATVKAKFRPLLEGGYVQVLTPDGVLFAAVPARIKSKAPSLVNVDDAALSDV